MYYKVNMKMSRANLELYFASVNGIEGKTVLRKQHREYMEQLIKIANVRSYAHFAETGECQQFTTGCVSANSNSLAEHIGCSPRTIRNYNALLEKYGLLTKIFRGTYHNYYLELNPYICPVNNIDDGNDYPILAQADGSDLRTRLCAQIVRGFFADCKRKKLPLKNNMLRQYNNQIIGKGVSDDDTTAAVVNNDGALLSGEGTLDKSAAVAVESLSQYVAMLQRFGIVGSLEGIDICKDTEAETHAAATPEVQQKPLSQAEIEKLAEERKKTSAAEKRLDDLENSEQQMAQLELDSYKGQCARMLLSYAMERIPGWNGKIYQGVIDEVAMSIKEQYFNELQNKAQCQFILSAGYITITFASRYIRKKLLSGKWDSFRMMPPTYFDRDTKNGFASFFSYTIQSEKARLRCKSQSERLETVRYYEKARKLNNRKLNLILQCYFSNPTKENYQNCIQRVRNTVPSRLNQFCDCVRNSRQRIANFWRKPENTALKPRIV